jgi:LPS sulfotransferase NodH
MVRIARRNNFVALEEFCNWLLDNFALEGVFGVSGGVKTLAPLVCAGEIPDCVADWRFVHLTREDFVARAVSELIARETHAFTSAKTPSKVVDDDDYDAVKLRRMIETTRRINAAWEGAFRTYGIEPYRLTYEALCEDPAGETAKIASFLQLQPPRAKDPRLAPPRLEKQATSANVRWAERFRAENGEFCKAQTGDGPQDF